MSETVQEDLLRRAAELFGKTIGKYRIVDAENWLRDYEHYRGAPAGSEYVWVPETSVRWELLGQNAELSVCRGNASCDGTPVARLNRSRDLTNHPRWWNYCVEHLYGRRIVDGVLQVRQLVPKGSTP